MRITVNLATRPFTDSSPALKRLRIGMAVLALVAVILGFGLRAMNEKAQEARAREHALDGQIARVTQERQGYQAMMQRPDNAQLLTQADSLNRLFDEKAFSWTLAMENLETVLPGGVQVSTIEPLRAKDGHITLHLRVIGPHDRSVELVRNLEHSRRFIEPRIVGENSDSSDNPNQRLVPVSASNRFTFDLQAEYNPPSADESKPSPGSKKNPAMAAADTQMKPAPYGRPQFTQQGVRPPYTGEPKHPSPRHAPGLPVGSTPVPGGQR